jgi:structure-specific recognition protein 1
MATRDGFLFSRLTMSREAFNDIYLNLSRKPGATRFSDSGFGWKPADGETYTCDQSQIIQAQWSRAARGYEIKILSRNDGVIQLDGFKQEVRDPLSRRNFRSVLRIVGF